MKREPVYITYLFIIWSLILIVAVALTYTTADKTLNRCYDDQITASNLSKKAMDLIKKRKEGLNIELSPKDIYESGMLGVRLTTITTTTGILEAKRTSINPNFAAVFIDMFKNAGINRGDEVAIVMSGSFPALNISAMAAAEVYQLKTCIMASIGASSYGANDPTFTYFDMSEYLNKENVFSNKIDYISFGGTDDTGSEFITEDRENILQRINTSEAVLINESDYSKNIDLRKKLILDKCPNIKLLINIGGNLVAMGKDEQAFISKNGLIKPNYTSSISINSKTGLIDTFLNMNVPVVQMLNIKGLALKYGLPYDSLIPPSIGDGEVYYEESYNIIIPVIALFLSLALLGFYYIYRTKKI